MRLGRNVAIVALAAVATFSVGTAAQADPNMPGSKVVAEAKDGSHIGWSIPGFRLSARQGGGIPSYETKTGENGAVSTIITIPDASAPKRYAFALDLPDGYVVEPQEGGSMTVNNDKGIPVGSFAAPWAKDALGVSVPTSLTMEGATLVQQVDFTADTAFPVTADPSWDWGVITGTIYLNINETRLMAAGGTAVSWLPTPFTMWGGRTIQVIAGGAAAVGKCVNFKVGLGMGGIKLLPGSPLPGGVGIQGIYYYSGGHCR
ncbi:hypothetical protein LQL77_31040 [Rhodococcus cerastii]|nr:hypothetical protein [Rhodococcus cerastii]